MSKATALNLTKLKYKITCRTWIQSIAQKTSNLIFVLATDAHSASYSKIKALSHHLWFPVALLISVTQGTKNESVWLLFKFMCWQCFHLNTCVTCSRSFNFSLELLQGAHQLSWAQHTKLSQSFTSQLMGLEGPREVTVSNPLLRQGPHSGCPVPGQVGCSTSAPQPLCSALC